MKINLPDLENYRALQQSKGANFPLKTIKGNSQGLLFEVPKAAPNQEGWPWTKQVDPSVYKDKDMWPKLTIVMPSYNQVKFVEQTIRSVLLQNYPNLEFIVIDGGSSDGSDDIIKKYSQWLSFSQSEKDRGQGHAINIGFSLASGSYGAFVNSDDHYLPETFLKVVNVFQTKNVEFVYGYALEYVITNQKYNPLVKVLPFLDYFMRIPSLAQPACFWCMKIYQPIWEELHCSLDYELWLRMLKNKKRFLIKEPLAVAAIHEDAKTHDPKMKDKWLADHYLICDEDAHGAVPNWNRIIFINKIRGKIYKWLRLN